MLEPTGEDCGLLLTPAGEDQSLTPETQDGEVLLETSAHEHPLETLVQIQKQTQNARI